MDASDPQSVLSQEELENAISEFSDADWIRIDKTANLYTSLYSWISIQSGDLIQEAILRALSGTRKCPRDVDVVKFLAETIRSIANGEAEKAEHNLSKVSLNDETTTIEIRSDNPSPEDLLAAKQESQNLEDKLIELFSGDETAQIIVLGILDGTTGEELRSLAELDETQFNSKRRKIRRTINHAIQNGLKP